jgi:hypothetical protein
MKANVEKFESGWVSLQLHLNADEIEVLIARLRELKNKSISHFHIRQNNWTDIPSVSDIEFSLAERVAENEDLTVD